MATGKAPKPDRPQRITVPRKPTLKTIAQISGLAVPTISRALNDAPDIGQQTKALVRQIAQEVGYVPNRAGVRLRTGRTNVIALVMSTEQDVMSHTARLISALATGLRDTPYHLNITTYAPDQDPMIPIRYIVETGSADALVMNRIEPDDPRVHYLMARRFPFVTHGRSNLAAQHPYYDFDNQAFGRIAVEQLVARGRRHILLIAPPAAQTYAQQMIAGVQVAADALGAKVALAQNVTSDSPRDAIMADVAGLLRQMPQIDAVIVGSTSAAMAAVAAIEAQGARLGAQIDLFAKEPAPFLKLFRAEILTVAEQVGTAGAFLARAAIQAIRDPDAPPMQALEQPSAAG